MLQTAAPSAKSNTGRSTERRHVGRVKRVTCLEADVVEQCRALVRDRNRAEETSLANPLGDAFMLNSLDRWRRELWIPTYHQFFVLLHIPQLPDDIPVIIVDFDFVPSATNLVSQWRPRPGPYRIIPLRESPPGMMSDEILSAIEKTRSAYLADPSPALPPRPQLGASQGGSHEPELCHLSSSGTGFIRDTILHGSPLQGSQLADSVVHLCPLVSGPSFTPLPTRKAL